VRTGVDGVVVGVLLGVKVGKTNVGGSSGVAVSVPGIGWTRQNVVGVGKNG